MIIMSSFDPALVRDLALTSRVGTQMGKYGKLIYDAFLFPSWFKHILLMTEHDKGLGRAKKLCLALSKTHTCTYNLFT